MHPTTGRYRRGVYRFLLSRQWVILTLVALLLIPTMIRLGIWQMHRYEERTARKVISRFLADGLLRSQGHREALSLAFPLQSLSILFPSLYPEAAAAVAD